MLIEIRAKQIQSSKKVENVLVANEFATGLGFGQNPIEFVEPALGNHVHVRPYLVAFWISDQVYIQASGMKENPGFYFCRHGSGIRSHRIAISSLRAVRPVGQLWPGTRSYKDEDLN